MSTARGSAVPASERLYRARRISTTFGRIYLGIRAHRLVARHLRPSDMDRRWSRFHRASARSIYEAAIELQGLILKGCQYLGSRADVLPREYVGLLSRLQDRVPPKPFPVARRTVEHELGCQLSDVFEEFSERPIASASLAQVHEARLRDGRRVAVKIQYPEIEALIRGDLANLRFLFRAVDILERDFDPMPLIDELGTHVPRELDFVNEGHNSEVVAKYFEGRDDIGVPAVHWDLTTRRVLVADFVDGVKVTDLEGLRAAGIDPGRVVKILAEAYCEQVFRRGFFHADPHPGNILVQSAASGGPRVVLVDFGLAKQLPAYFREGVLALAAALLRADPHAMAEALLQLGFETRDRRPESLAEVAGFVLDAALELRTRSHMTRRVGRELAEKIRDNPIVRIPAHIVFLARVLTLLSGVSRSLEVELDLVATLLPYALKR